MYQTLLLNFAILFSKIDNLWIITFLDLDVCRFILTKDVLLLDELELKQWTTFEFGLGFGAKIRQGRPKKLGNDNGS